MSRRSESKRYDCPQCGNTIKKVWMVKHYRMDHPKEYKRFGEPETWGVLKEKIKENQKRRYNEE